MKKCVRSQKTGDTSGRSSNADKFRQLRKYCQRATTPKFKGSDYFIHRAREELENFDQECVNHHTFHIGYNVANAFYGVIKVATRAGVCLQKV